MTLHILVLHCYILHYVLIWYVVSLHTKCSYLVSLVSWCTPWHYHSYLSRSTSLWAPGASSGSCQEMETAWSRHGTCLGGWVMPQLAVEMLDGQHQRLDLFGHAGVAHKGLLWKRLEEDHAESSIMFPWQPNWSRDQTELNLWCTACSYFIHSAQRPHVFVYVVILLTFGRPQE